MADEGVWTAEELAAAKAKANETLRRWRKNDLRIEIVEALYSMTGNRDAAKAMADQIMLLIEDSERKLAKSLAEHAEHQEVDLAAGQAVLDLASSTEHSVDCVLNALHLPQITRERNQFREALEEAQVDRDRYQSAWEQACEQIAAMHAAAVGEVRGPIRGVVEDVADLRTSRDQLGRDVNAASRMAARATQDLFDEEQEHEELALTVNEAIMRITRAGFYNSEDAGEVVQMLREVLNGTSVNDTIRHTRGARWFVETVAGALGIPAPDTATPHDVIEETARQHQLGLDLASLLDELDQIVADWKGDWNSTTQVIQRLSVLVANGGEGSALVSELEAWQGSYFRLRNEALKIAAAAEDTRDIPHEFVKDLRAACAADEPLRRDYAYQHRFDNMDDL